MATDEKHAKYVIYLLPCNVVFGDFLVVYSQPSPKTEYSFMAFAFKDLKCALPLLILCTVSPLLTLLLRANIRAQI